MRSCGDARLAWVSAASTPFPGIDPDEERARHHEALRPVRDAARKVVHFELPDGIAGRLNRIVEEIERKPPMLERLTVEGGSRRDWYFRFGDGISWSVREGLGASYYHAGNAEEIEATMMKRCTDALEELEAPDWPSVTRLYTRKLNYEYQAFQFALRRTLDYLARAAGAFFKTECTSINGLAKALEQTDFLEISGRVIARVEGARANLADVIEKPNVRDQIAHYEAVEAGQLNIHWGKNFTIVSLAAGGEKFSPFMFSTNAPPRRYGSSIGFLRLTPALRSQLERVERLVFDVLAELGFPS
jgi:hypothetical protein